MPPRTIDEYQVGWVCAIPKEMTAAQVALDEEHVLFRGNDPQDNNNYVLGRVGNHNVVIACLPAGVYGTNAAATVATNMMRTFPGLRFAVMVGIGGGIPDPENLAAIRLGDVVVSQPDGTHGGVVQYDLGKSYEGGKFELKGSLNMPPQVLLTALSKIQSKPVASARQVSETLTTMMQHPEVKDQGYAFPGVQQDRLACPRCTQWRSHLRAWWVAAVVGLFCVLQSWWWAMIALPLWWLPSWCQCCEGGTILRPIERTEPDIHYGVIASGNRLMKNMKDRDRLGKQLKAKCIEMEAAGLMSNFPCMVIRGICDYADAHKNDAWQKYATLTAAAFAKILLTEVPPAEVIRTSRATEVIEYDRGLNLFDAPNIDDSLFIGRQTEVEAMASILKPQSENLGSSRRLLVLGGMGGIGKTQLALTYAKRYSSCYSLIFWLNATSELSLKASLRRVANRTHPPEKISELDDEQVYAHVSNWLSQHDNARWLLIFDNYDDPEEYQLQKYYPFVAQGSIIITTRQPSRVNGEQVKLQSITEPDESVRILAMRSRRENAESDPYARQLAQRLDGYPLALATAGAFLSHSSVSFAQYLRQYEAKWRVIDSMEELSDYPSRTLYTTWNLSFARIEEQSPRAAHLLRFLAYFDHQDIWFGLLHGGVKVDQPAWFTDIASDEFIFEDAMSMLTRYCLVDAHHQTGSYSLHTCVHDWTLNELNHKIDRERYWLAFDCVATYIREEEWSRLSRLPYQRLTGHAKRLVHNRFWPVDHRDASAQSKLDEIANLAELLQQQMQYKEAEVVYMWMLVLQEQEMGPEHFSTLDVVHNLACLHLVHGNLEAAEPMFKRALIGYQRTLGDDHEAALLATNNLGILYMAQARLKEAETLYLRALAGYEDTLGPEHPSALKSTMNLGNLYLIQGKAEVVEEMYMRALVGYREALGADHLSTLETIQDLGVLFMIQGKLQEADAKYVEALAGMEQTLGPDHRSTLYLKLNIGTLRCLQGQLAEAEKVYEHTLSGFRRGLGPSNIYTIGAMNNLANLYCEQGRYSEAEECYEEAFNAITRTLQRDHYCMWGVINNRGLLNAEKGNAVDARRMYHEARDGFDRLLGPDHANSKMVRYNLQQLDLTQGPGRVSSPSGAQSSNITEVPRRRWYYD